MTTPSQLFFCGGILMVIVRLLTAQAVVKMSDRTDVMGQHRVVNRLQCGRLCWYRPLCLTYSYNPLATGNNCVLHASPLQGAPLPSDWTMHNPTAQGIRGSCAARPCADTEVCTPVVTSSGAAHYACLLVPADCGAPSFSNARVTWTGTQQTHVATLTCDSTFELTPQGSTGQMTCHVTARWSPLNVYCVSSANQCHNSGVHDPATGVCDCTGTGFIGATCTADDPCDPNPCDNGGTCIVSSLNTTTCSCSTGFYGTTCENQLCPANQALLPHVSSVQWSTRGDDWLTGYILACDDDYITSQDDGYVRCYNDNWWGAECRRRVFHNPTLDVTHAIPRPLVPGWKACVQGTPTDDSRFSFFLMETPDTSWAYLDFKMNYIGYHNHTLIMTKDYPYPSYVNDQEYDLDPSPFSPGKDFNMTFTFVTETQLQVEAGEVVMEYNYTRGLWNVTGVWISHAVSVTSMDLWC